jgi:hypothetical protein
VFQIPSFTFWNVTFTAIGAAVYWGKWGRTKLKAYVLSDIVNLMPLDERWRSAIEFSIFLVIGSIVGIAIVQPTNATQALTAGFGWTGLFAHRVQ